MKGRKGRKDNGMQEEASLEYFKRVVPRNPRDWDGSIVLYSVHNESFFVISFGDGSNLDGDDIEEGFDDYIMVDQFDLDHEGRKRLMEIFVEAKRNGYLDSSEPGLVEMDGGQWLLKHKDWKNGDIRRFIMEALDFAGYGLPEWTECDWYKDIVYVGADYDDWGNKKGNKK